MCTDGDANLVLEQLSEVVSAMEIRVEEGRTVIYHLERQLVNMVYEDASITVGQQLMLPILQERLEARAAESLSRKADEAAEELLRMEEPKVEWV